VSAVSVPPLLIVTGPVWFMVTSTETGPAMMTVSPAAGTAAGAPTQVLAVDHAPPVAVLVMVAAWAFVTIPMNIPTPITAIISTDKILRLMFIRLLSFVETMHKMEYNGANYLLALVFIEYIKHWKLNISQPLISAIKYKKN
jgi:hypothetical protein